MDIVKNFIWQRYERALEHHLNENMFEITRRCHDFYIGNQWRGIEEREELPSINFIKPICRYKISNIAQNNMNIVYSPISGDDKTHMLCKVLNKFALVQWDRIKMDSKIWQMLKNSCITGGHYIYFFTDEMKSGSKNVELKARMIHGTDIFFADETNTDINLQPWIIIAERLPLSKVVETAKVNGLSEEEIALITSDEDEYTNFSSSRSHEENIEYCTGLLYMELTPEGVTFSRSVKGVVYAPSKLIEGLSVYPVAGLIWEEKPGSARGVGNVANLIANQMEVNKTLARRSVMTKRDAYNKLAYDKNKVSNIEDLDKAGAKIEIENLEGNPLDTIIQYLRPAPISQDASELQNELINLTRAMEGAGDAAVGLVDPTKASGAAIKAARDQAAIPLSEQVATFKQFVEDVAIIWYVMWRVYATNGIEVEYIKNGQSEIGSITHEQINELEVNIKVDVSPTDPYSKLSSELALERVLERGYINFEEYLQLLDDYSTVPKRQLEEIISVRNEKSDTAQAV